MKSHIDKVSGNYNIVGSKSCYNNHLVFSLVCFPKQKVFSLVFNVWLYSYMHTQQVRRIEKSNDWKKNDGRKRH